MDADTIEIIAMVLVFLFLLSIPLLFIVVLIRFLYKSKRYRKFAKKWDLGFYGIEDIRERLDDIAEIRKSNAEILEKLNRLIEEKEGERTE